MDRATPPARYGQAAITFRNKSLAEVAALVSAHLANRGIQVVIVGGSAITCHVPTIYTSDDIDLAVTTGIDRRALDQALAELGFARAGRAYRNAETSFTIDVVAETPYIDQRAIQDFAAVETDAGRVRTYLLEDAVADRVAAFLHWNDSERAQPRRDSCRGTLATGAGTSCRSFGIAEPRIVLIHRQFTRRREAVRPISPLS